MYLLGVISQQWKQLAHILCCPSIVHLCCGNVDSCSLKQFSAQHPFERWSVGWPSEHIFPWVIQCFRGSCIHKCFGFRFQISIIHQNQIFHFYTANLLKQCGKYYLSPLVSQVYCCFAFLGCGGNTVAAMKGDMLSRTYKWLL